MNDSELALLALIAESKASSGYALAAAARARGMERWAGLSTSSVYKGLRRLEVDGLVETGSLTKKRGKGPPGKMHAITAAGTRSLRRAISDGLAGAPEQSARYRLSLAFVEAIGPRRASAQLRRRTGDLEARIEDVARARARGDDGGALGRSLIFAYVLHGLEQERAVTARLLRILSARGRA